LANILVIDDDRNIRRTIAATLSGGGHRAIEADSGESALAQCAAAEVDLAVCDVRMAGMDGFKLLEELKRRTPSLPVVMMTAFGTISDAVRAMRLGAYDYLPKPFSADQLRQIVTRVLEVQSLRNENHALKSKLDRLSDRGKFLAFSPSTQALAETARQIADADATVLLTGESGTGKTLLAGQIHRASSRRDSPFIEVACTTLNEHLLESELFGHVRGAFTGAIKDKPGRLEAAEGGTIFLDEIGDLTPALQAKLLRFLQERTFERVGGAELISIDARIIAATNQNLEGLVQEHRFREDLFYRLNVIEMRVPALRERANEIVPLAESFVEHFAARHRKPVRPLTAEAKAVLSGYEWPGNVRELRNVIERAVVLSRGEAIGIVDFPDRILSDGSTADPSPTLENIERKHIKTVLEQALTLEEAAEMLGINVATLWRKRKRYGFD
jgi:two-component system, NtrC family, response regulator AlgB